jgi:hypothetical protein
VLARWDLIQGIAPTLNALDSPIHIIDHPARQAALHKTPQECAVSATEVEHRGAPQVETHKVQDLLRALDVERSHVVLRVSGPCVLREKLVLVIDLLGSGSGSKANETAALTQNESSRKLQSVGGPALKQNPHAESSIGIPVRPALVIDGSKPLPLRSIASGATKVALHDLSRS